MSGTVHDTIADMLRADEQQRAEVSRRVSFLFWATVVLWVVVISFGFYGFLLSKHDRAELRREEVKTESALCTYRRDLDTRIQSTIDFLRTHPAGIPGVPLAVLESSLNNQRSTVRALEALDCPPPLKP